MEEFLQSWLTIIGSAQKNPDLQKFKGPMQFVTYMKAGIEGLKVYMPLLSAIKGKGLEKRHFAQIQKETGIDINLQKMNLKDLKSMGIHFGALLEKVKMISEGATRENQIK